MDAYLFSREASAAAVAELVGRARPEGPVRVVCPLTGSHALYVALAAPDQQSLADALDELTSLEGLGSVSTEIPVPGQGGIGYDLAVYPTHCSVEAFVGFTILTGAGSFLSPTIEEDIPGVVGVAVVNEDPLRVIVEVTAASQPAVQALLQQVGALRGTAIELVATGETSLGAGFRRQ